MVFCNGESKYIKNYKLKVMVKGVQILKPYIPKPDIDWLWDYV